MKYCKNCLEPSTRPTTAFDKNGICLSCLSFERNRKLFDENYRLDVLNDIAAGGVKKIIFAGYATDPLNSPYISELLEKAIGHNLIFGFNTKALKVPNRLLEIIQTSEIARESYISLSVDAGSNETYNKMHAIKSNVKLSSPICGKYSALNSLYSLVSIGLNTFSSIP